MSAFFYDKDIPFYIVEENKVKRKVKSTAGGLMYVEVYFEDYAVGAPHTHVHEQETYCLEGEFEFNIGGEIGIIKPGDTIYMPSGVLHGCKLLTEKGRLLDVFTPIREDFL